MKLGSYLMFAAASALLSAQGAAQKKVQSPEAIVEMHKIARCIASRTTSLSEKIFIHLPGSKESVTAFYRTHPDTCGEFDGALHLKDNFIRGAIAEQLLLKNYSSLASPSKRSLGSIFHWPEPNAIAELKEQTKMMLAAIALGECAARAAPEKSFDLFGTKVNSDEEKAAVQALVPELSGCIFEGQSFDLNVATVRALMAEGAYRVATSNAHASNQASR